MDQQRPLEHDLNKRPLPPKWSETQSQIPTQCDHPVWVAHVKVGEPLSVSTCQLCRAINWDELRADFEKLTAGFVSQDGEVICWKGQNYIRQGDEPDQVEIIRGDGKTIEQRHFLLKANEIVNTEERPEDALRRYARRLVELQEGLKARGIDLSQVSEDGVVSVALEALDEAIGAAKAWAESTGKAGPD